MAGPRSPWVITPFGQGRRVSRASYQSLVPRSGFSFLVPDSRSSFRILVPRSGFSFLVPDSRSSFRILVPRSGFLFLVPDSRSSFWILVPRSGFSFLVPDLTYRFITLLRWCVKDHDEGKCNSPGCVGKVCHWLWSVVMVRIHGQESRTGIMVIGHFQVLEHFRGGAQEAVQGSVWKACWGA